MSRRWTQGIQTATLVATLAVAAVALAQPLLSDYQQLPREARFYFVAGYVEGFALAAQMPPEKGAALQKCFGEWGVPKVMMIFNAWLDRNRDKVSRGDWTARIGLFTAIAEEC